MFAKVIDLFDFFTGAVFFSCHVIIQMNNKHRKLFPDV